MLRRPRALLAALALTGLVAVGALIATVLKLWGPWPPTDPRDAALVYWGGFGGVIWAGCSVLLICVALALAARPRRRLHYVIVLVVCAAMAALGLGTGALWTHAGVRDCARGFCRIAIAVLALSDVLFALWLLSFALALYSLLRSDAAPGGYATTTERASRDVRPSREKERPRETPDTSVGKSSENPTLTSGVPVLTSGVPTSPLPPLPYVSSSPPSRTEALKDTLSTFRPARARRASETQSTTASLIPYLSPYDLDALQALQPGRGRSIDHGERRADAMGEEEAPFETRNVSFGKRSTGSTKRARKPLDGLW